MHEATPVPAEPVAIRSEPRPFTVGTVAVVSTRKGSDVFVDAASRLLREGDGGFRFEMVGDAHELIERNWALDLLREARSAGIEHIPSTDVLDRLRDWDAFVLPSRSDPFPISMLEAMASGLPVVGTRRDGIAEQIAAGTGLLIEAEDAGALADAIVWCADQPADTRAPARIRRAPPGHGGTDARAPGRGHARGLRGHAGRGRRALAELDVAVDDPRVDVVAHREVAGDALGDRDRPVASAGAADRDRQVGLALGDVRRQQEVEQRQQPRVELARRARPTRRTRRPRRRGR